MDRFNFYISGGRRCGRTIALKNMFAPGRRVTDYFIYKKVKKSLTSKGKRQLRRALRKNPLLPVVSAEKKRMKNIPIKFIPISEVAIKAPYPDPFYVHEFDNLVRLPDIRL